ncbi:MAG TPA: M20/M25/M40 family metallo-hydrolase [Pyrinomonadaceae bacterium]|nr:M20/M25/M40 family metallo-hydrolase [Pyrinomonadaceae bacterium]
MQTALTITSALSVAEMMSALSVQSAFQFFDSHADSITDEHIRICSIPASPFAEAARADYLNRRLQEIGLVDNQIDEEGNCVALRKGSSLSPLLVVSAHLDTVFPVGTDFTVRHAGSKLLAPGISDDGSGLAALIALARALESANIETEGSLLFVGTVGEEGAGNLRGVRYLLNKGVWANRVDAFLSFDGGGIHRITNSALGSRRYRVGLRGTGGHSWADFGVSNPIHVLGSAIAKLTSYPAPTEPRTTFNVGRIEGGSSVNAIPGEATMEVDLRSTSEDELLRLDAFFRRAVREAATLENGVRRKDAQPLKLSLELIGERPSGETPPHSPIVKLAEEATRVLGFTARLEQASTDSNVPISMGIPAITLGAGGLSGHSHTLDEWYDPRGREAGLKRALLVVLGLVGIKTG